MAHRSAAVGGFHAARERRLRADDKMMGCAVADRCRYLGLTITWKQSFAVEMGNRTRAAPCVFFAVCRFWTRPWGLVSVAACGSLEAGCYYSAPMRGVLRAVGGSVLAACFGSGQPRSYRPHGSRFVSAGRWPSRRCLPSAAMLQRWRLPQAWQGSGSPLALAAGMREVA